MSDYVWTDIFVANWDKARQTYVVDAMLSTTFEGGEPLELVVEVSGPEDHPAIKAAIEAIEESGANVWVMLLGHAEQNQHFRGPEDYRAFLLGFEALADLEAFKALYLGDENR